MGIVSKPISSAPAAMAQTKPGVRPPPPALPSHAQPAMRKQTSAAPARPFPVPLPKPHVAQRATAFGTGCAGCGTGATAKTGGVAVPPPWTAGGGIVQRSTVEQKSPGLPPPSGPGKKVPGKSAKDKKAEKQGAGAARRLLVVLADRKKLVEACEAGVTFSQSFNTHVMQGEGSGGTHVGYHSQSETNFAAFGACVITDALDGHGVLKADCTMPGRAAKNSSFFPAGWDVHRIRAEARHAFCRAIDRGGIAGAGALAWVGPSTVDGLLIGGASGLPLNTAFPSYNGTFA
ncbi:MAG: hypothetical protein ACJ8GW_19600 [Massilia sp.]